MAIDVEALYKKYGPMVLRRCRSLLKDEELALDTLQEVFVRILKSQAGLEDRGLCSLLYTVATRACLNVIRQRKQQPQTREDQILVEIAAFDDHEDRSLARDVTDRFFASDLASSRTLAVLYFVDGLTLAEAAQSTGLSISGVRKRLAKVKRRGRLLREATF